MIEKQADASGAGEPHGDHTLRQPHPRILEEVLQRTILQAAEKPVTDEDLATLVPVARAHSSKSIDGAMPFLVDAMLRRIFGSEMDSSWSAMTRVICDSLLDDPSGRLRSEQLWNRLLAVQE